MGRARLKYEDAITGYTSVTYILHRGRIAVINLGTIWIWRAT
jgi:hypothetical protein